MRAEKTIEITIRQAVESDLPAIVALHNELEITEHAANEPLLLSRAKAVFERISSYPDYKVFLALFGEQVVGTFALLIMDNLAHNCSPSGIIEDVVVTKHWQGKGIGKTMMLYALEQARLHDCYKVVLSSNLNRLNAHEFYENLGFVKHGYSFSMELSR